MDRALTVTERAGLTLDLLQRTITDVSPYPNVNIATNMSRNSNSSGIVIIIIATRYCVCYVLPSASMISHETLTLKLHSPTVIQQVAELDLKPALDLLWCLSEVGI